MICIPSRAVIQGSQLHFVLLATLVDCTMNCQFTTGPGEQGRKKEEKKNHPMIPYLYAWAFTDFTVRASIKNLVLELVLV